MTLANPIIHSGFRDALAEIMAELFDNRTLVLLTGAAGVGKTLLLRELARILQAAGWQVVAGGEHDPVLTRLMDRDYSAFTPIAILIDGAEPINPIQLQRLLRLGGVAVVMAVSDTTAKQYPSGKPIRLASMSAETSAAYIDAWLHQAGHPPDLVIPNLLSRDGHARILEIARGNARSISSLLGTLLPPGRPLPATPISPRDVDEAAQQMNPPIDISPVRAQSTDHPAIPDTGPSTPTQRSAEALAEDHLMAAFAAQGTAENRLSAFWSAMPTSLVNAALAGLLGGVGFAIVVLLLLDLIPALRNGPNAETADPVVTHAPPALQTRPPL